MRVALVYFDAGGGHRNAALALSEIIRQQRLPWQANLVNLQELLDPIDFVRRFTGIRIQDVYNRMLQHGWTLGSPQLMRVLQLAIRMRHGATVRLIEQYWRKSPADMVISLVPHFNRALGESFRGVFPGRPFITLLTDLADYPPHFWIEPARNNPQHLICGSQRAYEQAQKMGHRSGHIWLTSGMILNPRFYQMEPISDDDRAAEIARLGLDPTRTTGLVLFGGEGCAGKMLRIDRLLGGSRLPIQLILICGRNARLREQLRARKSAIPRFVEGFTREIPHYMQLSDFFIGKPGPGSISEALFMRLPVIVECNAWTLPQERYNTDWILERQVGLVLRNFTRIVEAVATLIDPGNFSRLRCNTAAIQNRALLEIPEILSRIAAAHR